MLSQRQREQRDMGKRVGIYLRVSTKEQTTENQLSESQQVVDTSTPSGRALFGMLAVFAEFEREMIRDRVNAGLTRAKSKGKRLGRPSLPEATAERVRELRASGIGILKVASTLGVGVSA